MPEQATVLTNVNISDTFYGLLHAGGQPIAATGQAQIYDGNGGTTSLKLGINCNGATICGGLSATTLSATNLSLSTPILSSILPNVTPNPAGTYTGYLTGISVTSKGIVTGVSATPTIPLPYKAYAVASYTGGAYNASASQGSSFTIAGNNIASITWLKRGLYRVTFATPMSNINYLPILQNTDFASASGKYPWDSPTLGGDAGYTIDNNIFVSFKALNFFEFGSSTGAGLNAENIFHIGILVI